MDGTLLLIAGWILVVAFTGMLLRYRLLIRHYDQQLLKATRENPNPLHCALQNQMTSIDQWAFT